MELFDKDKYLTDEEKINQEFKDSHHFLVAALLLVCKTPFTFIGLVISIIYKSLFSDSKMTVKKMDIEQKQTAANEFIAHGNRLKQFGEKSLTDEKIIELTEKEYRK